MPGVMVAYFLPKDIAEQCYDAAKAAKLDPVAVEDMHLTLAFLGDTNVLADQCDYIEGMMAFIASWLRPITGKLAGTGRFNASESSDGLDPFYASVDMPFLADFRQKLVNIMSWNGVEIDRTHGFTPHITLGYLNKDDATPDMRIPDIQMRLDTLTLAWGDDRQAYRLVRKELVGEMPQPKSTLQIFEGRHNDKNQTLIEMVSVIDMAAGYPDIPLPKDIELGDDPLFVTLPVGAVNAESRNQRTYRRDAMLQMLQQINERRPEGMWGHLRDEEFGTRYDPPGIRWLAAVMDEAGTIWAKGRPLDSKTREYYRQAKLDNARVGTSLFAWAEMDGADVVALDLITVDIADPARVGVPMTAARPLVTTEMGQEESADTTARSSPSTPEADSSDGTKNDQQDASATAGASFADTIEMKVGRPMSEETTSVILLKHQQEVQKLNEQITALEKQRDTLLAVQSRLNVVRDLVRLPEGADGAAVVDAVRRMSNEHHAMAAEATMLLESALDAQLAEKIKVEGVRPLARELVMAKAPKTRADLDAALDDVLNRDSVKSLLVAGLKSEMGDSQTVRGEATNSGKTASKFKLSPVKGQQQAQ